MKITKLSLRQPVLVNLLTILIIVAGLFAWKNMPREIFPTIDRQTVIDLMTELARTEVGGRPLGECIEFYTEATEFDVYKNRDLLPLARAGGLRSIYFGITVSP